MHLTRPTDCGDWDGEEYAIVDMHLKRCRRFWLQTFWYEPNCCEFTEAYVDVSEDWSLVLATSNGQVTMLPVMPLMLFKNNS